MRLRALIVAIAAIASFALPSTAMAQGGGKTLDTTVMAASNTRMAIVQVISRLSDNAGHETLVKQIVSGK